ncbi:signal peptidase I [Parasphingopyxis lamellibrachiae]|nr:signal peptidase I [Parasphingopyxis lamellibrachiae]
MSQRFAEWREKCRKLSQSSLFPGLTGARASSTSPAMLRELDEKTGDGSPRPPPGQPYRRTLFGWVRFIVSLAILAILVRSLVIAPFNIPSRSMTPTMLVGDYLFVAKWPYGYSRYSFPFAPEFIHGRIGNGRPDRGEIVVFRSPAVPASSYIKRVIGLPGDRVQMIAGELHLNGEAVARETAPVFAEPVDDAGTCASEPGSNSRLESADDGSLVCYTPRYRETLPGGRSYLVLDAGDSTADTTQEFIVPAGHYFLMGDDRDRSADSRFPAVPGGGIGFVPEENIIGRALVIFWSTDGSASWINPISWFSATRWDRIGSGF